MRSIRFAYAVPPLLALVLGFLGVGQLAENGIPHTRAIVTAVGEPSGVTNRAIARSLTAVAERHDATVVRLVADREAPERRRLALVTSVAGSAGADWLRQGYPDFSRGMSTSVRSMGDLYRFDPSGSYRVLGDDPAVRATSAVLRSAGFSVQVDAVPPLTRIGVSSDLGSAAGLVASLLLGSAALCGVSTIAAPRRIAVRRMAGQSLGRVLTAELSESRFVAWTALAAAPLVTVGLWAYNGLADLPLFLLATTVWCGAITVPTLVAHGLGTLVAHRAPLGPALRGARPRGAVVVAAQLARVPALVLLVASVFDLSASIAVARSSDAVRDVRAAGETVQLWVTPEPLPEIQTQEFWDRLGEFTGQALGDGAALLAAPAEIDAGTGSVPALFVDQEYLRRHPLHGTDGRPVSSVDDRISVWFPHGARVDRQAVVEGLVEWQLRAAGSEDVTRIRTADLGDRELYAYSGDATTTSWLRDPVVVVVPDPASTFSADQLGSWLSTGDVVFVSSAAADRALASSDVRAAISAVVAVGQDAADRARRAVVDVGVTSAAVASGLVVTLVLAVAATGTARRRGGRLLFARIAAGRSFSASNAGLLGAECTFLVVGAVATIDTWWSLRPDGTGRSSLLDPVARAADAAAGWAALALVGTAALNLLLIARTHHTTARTRGAER